MSDPNAPRPVAEQIKRTYTNRARPVVPSGYEVNHLQVWTREQWIPAPWYRPLLSAEQATRPAAA